MPIAASVMQTHKHQSQPAPRGELTSEEVVFAQKSVLQ
jgi:hypothetical protein